LAGDHQANGGPKPQARKGLAMAIPTEPIGSLPRPGYLMEAFARRATNRISLAEFEAACDRALSETIAEFEATGSPIITDGEQTKPSFATYPLAGLKRAQAQRAVAKLLEAGLVKETRAKAGAPIWRRDDETGQT